MILILVCAFFRRKNCAIFVIEPTRTCVKHKIECIFVASFKLILSNEKNLRSSPLFFIFTSAVSCIFKKDLYHKIDTKGKV